MDKLEPSYISGGNKKWYGHLESSLAVLQKIKHKVTTRPSNSTPGYSPKRNESLCPHRTVYECSQQHCSNAQSTYAPYMPSSTPR